MASQQHARGCGSCLFTVHQHIVGMLCYLPGCQHACSSLPLLGRPLACDHVTECQDEAVLLQVCCKRSVTNSILTHSLANIRN